MKVPQGWKGLRIGGALTWQAALLFLFSILPVLVIVGWFNYQHVSTTVQERIGRDYTSRVSSMESELSNVLLRELERATTLTRAPAMRALTTPVHAESDAALQQAYEQAAPGDGVRLSYIDNAAGRLLKDFREQFPNRAVVLLADTQGRLEGVTTPAWPYWNVARQPWWPDMARLGRDAYSISAPTDMPGFGSLLFLTAPVLDVDDKPAGLLVVGLRFPDTVSPILGHDLNASPGSTAMLINGDGVVLYATPAWPTPQLPASWQPVIQPVEWNTRAVDGNLVGYAPLQVAEGYALDEPVSIRTLNRRNWRVLQIVPSNIAYAAVDEELRLLSLGTGATALIIVLLAVIGVRIVVTKPLQRLDLIIADVERHGLANEVAVRGRQRLPRSHNEIGRLGQRFGRMLDKLTQFSEEKEQTYARQQAIVAGLRDAAAKLSSAAAEQELITNTTSAGLSQMLDAFRSLDEAALSIAAHAQQVAQQATELKSQHEAGESALFMTQTALSELQQTAQALEHGARSLAEDTKAAGALVGEANEVADNTHLLSLNASIEAAGAGEYGRRFSIIAGEVRNLAEVASRAAGSIEEALERMKSQTDQTASATHQARLAADSGAQQMSVLSNMMQMLLQSSDRLAETAQTIHERSTDQRNQSSEIHLSSNQLASAMQQVTIASRHVSVQAQELLELANVLDQAHPVTAHPVGAGASDDYPLAGSPQVAGVH